MTKPMRPDSVAAAAPAHDPGLSVAHALLGVHVEQLYHAGQERARLQAEVSNLTQEIATLKTGAAESAKSTK